MAGASVRPLQNTRTINTLGPTATMNPAPESPARAADDGDHAKGLAGEGAGCGQSSPHTTSVPYVGGQVDCTVSGTYSRVLWGPRSTVKVRQTHPYSEPGTYFVAVRATTQRQDAVDSTYARVANLGRHGLWSAAPDPLPCPYVTPSSPRRIVPGRRYGQSPDHARDGPGIPARTASCRDVALVNVLRTRIAGPARSSSAIRRACGYSDPLPATRTLGRHDAVRCPAAVRLPAVRVFASSAMTVPSARSSFGRRTCAFPALRCSSQTLRAVNPDEPSPAVGIGHAARRSRLSLPFYCGAGTGRQGHRAPCPPGPWESRRGTTRICPSDRLDEVERTTAVRRGRYDGT